MKAERLGRLLDDLVWDDDLLVEVPSMNRKFNRSALASLPTVGLAFPRSADSRHE